MAYLSIGWAPKRLGFVFLCHTSMYSLFFLNEMAWATCCSGNIEACLLNSLDSVHFDGGGFVCPLNENPLGLFHIRLVIISIFCDAETPVSKSHPVGDGAHAANPRHVRHGGAQLRMVALQARLPQDLLQLRQANPQNPAQGHPPRPLPQRPLQNQQVRSWGWQVQAGGVPRGSQAGF